MVITTALSDVTQTSEQGATLLKRMNLALLNIIRDNLTTKYASQAPLLAEFRDAVCGTETEDTLLANFRVHVPLSDYDSYRPFVDRFNVQPCKEQDVENLFAPGLPDFLAASSATSGTRPKILPKYNHTAKLKLTCPFLDPNSKYPLAALVCTGYRDVKMVERASSEVVQRIPLCIASGGTMRRALGLHTDDERQMSLSMSGFAAPWAATVIRHFPSFLIIHGLFFLARGDVHRFYVPFATHFVDLIRHINEHWDMLISCIRDGTLPDLKGIDHVRKYLQAHFYPNAKRAAELLEIGPPFSLEGWFARVWPNVSQLLTICGGPFATVLPKVRFILGPNVSVRVPEYGASEAQLGLPHDPTKLDEFVLQSDDFVEFLDISLDATHENLRQAWEVEVGRSYEPIVTTRDGLWRYRLGDVLCIVGFDTKSRSPVFRYAGRRSLTIRLHHTQTTDDQLLAAIQVISSKNEIQVHEFTTVLDYRALLPTLGFFVELAGPFGPNAHLAPQKLFDALAEIDTEHKLALQDGRFCLPTIRIVKAGTFAEYRQWKGEHANIASGQIKVPLILVDPTAQEWILERVVQEL